MNEQERFEAFMQRVLQRPLPNDPMARVRTLAKELAEGALNNFWQPRDSINQERCRIYLQNRWNSEYHQYAQFLAPYGYTQNKELTKPAFDLIEEVEPATIFISYRRKDSSAFALLVLKSLKEAGLNAFVDMSIQPGDDWHAYIHEQIKAHDFFILLLGKETLQSEIVRKEMLWAIEAGATILPIWHNGFEYQAAEWNLPAEIDHVLQNTHTIRVLEESAIAYNNAIVELLNRFGITP